MADYYPLIARAIAGLDPSAPGESRRALYERARAALIAQLRSVEPPLSESEITRERLSLEEAVRKVESEAAQRARDATRDGSRPAAPAPAMRSAPTPAPRRAAAKPDHRRPRRHRPALRRVSARHLRRRPGASVRRSDRTTARNATSAPTGRRRHGCNSRRSRCRIRSCRRPASDRARRAAAPTTARRRPRACAASATSPPMPTISAAPPRRPTAPREKPTPTCRRRRRSSTGSSRPWKTAAPMPRRPIPMTNRSRRPSATPRKTSTASRSRLAPDREPKNPARTGAAFPFKSAIAIGVVLILVGAAILWGKSALTTVSGLFKPSTTVVEAPKDTRRCRSRRFPIASASRPLRTGRPGGAARRAV